jgi:hypothetical protein
MKPAKQATRVVVVTSAMLSLVSFWRAAAIVLNDLGSSAFFVGGIAEQAVGHAAPCFILGVMLFSYAVRAVHIESIESAEVINGPSPLLQPKEQARRFRKAWKKLPKRPDYQILFRIIDSDGNNQEFFI